MDTLRAVRLALYFIVGLLLGGFAVAASADTYSAQQGYLMSCSVPGPYGTAESGGTACGEYEGAENGWHSGYLFRCDPSPYNKCYYRHYRTQADATAQNPLSAVYNYTYGYSCPYGGTLTQVGGTWECQSAPSCPAGQVRNESGQCSDPPNPCAGLAGFSPAHVKDIQTGYTETGAFCHESCQAVSAGGFSMCSPSGGWCVFEAIQYTGESCASGDPQPDPTSPQCKQGQGPVEINGTTVCADVGRDPTVKSQGKKTDVKTVTNSDGSTTTTTTTTTTNCTEGSCNTTTVINTTTTDPSGNVTSNDTTTTENTESLGGFCDSNPGSAQCGNDDSAFGGDCDTGFSCQGDAVECATARGAWETACAFRASDGQSVAEQIIAGNDPEAGNMPWHPSQKQSNDVSGLLNQTNPYGASCIPDIHFSIAGRSGTIPTSEWCSMLTWIGNLMLAGALMGAAAIIFRRS